MATDVNKLYSDLREKISSIHNNKEELVIIDKAFQIANDYHGDQLRRSGEPYIIHPEYIASAFNCSVKRNEGFFIKIIRVYNTNVVVYSVNSCGMIGERIF